jgi:hypothetical protein
LPSTAGKGQEGEEGKSIVESSEARYRAQVHDIAYSGLQALSMLLDLMAQSI